MYLFTEKSDRYTTAADDQYPISNLHLYSFL